MKALLLFGIALTGLGASRGWNIAVLYGATLAIVGILLWAWQAPEKNRTSWWSLALLAAVGAGWHPAGVLLLLATIIGLLLIRVLRRRAETLWKEAEEGRQRAAQARDRDWAGLEEAEKRSRQVLEEEVDRNEALRNLIAARDEKEIPALLSRHASRFAPKPEDGEEPETMLEAIRPLLDQARLVLIRLRRIKELQQVSRTDWLTGLPNRRALDERLETEGNRTTTLGMKLSRVMIDIDRFKRLNDLHGHAIGDQALVQLARHLRALTRKTDFVARYGGEEFAMLLPETPIEAAVNLAERLRVKLRDEPLRPPGLDRPIPVTVSIGVSDQSLEEADAALYRAKEGGRDRVETGDRNTP